MDEHEKLQKLKEIRLIITEILMFFSVILLVGFLTLIVMGYSFNLFEIGGTGEVVERTGLVQISSIPTGATIAIDGGTPLLLRTNGSRTVLAGEHEISLSRDGFDTWTKTVNVTEGMMYRVNYPRLFLVEREPEEIIDFEKAGITFTSVTPNAERMVILVDGELGTVELNSSKPVLKKLVYQSAEQISEKTSEKITEISEIEWSGNSERLLSKINGEIVFLNIKNPLETVNLTEVISEFNKKNELERSAEQISEKTAEETNKKPFEKVEIKEAKFESEAGDKILILTTKNELREVNIRDKEVSEALLENVLKFDNDGERIAYLTSEKNEEKTLFELKAYRSGAEESYLIRLVRNADVKIAAMKYFQDFYFMVEDEGLLKIYSSANWPERDDVAEKIFEGKLDFSPTILKKRGKGMVFSFENGEKKAVFDIEALGVTEFEASGKTGWVDEFLRFSVGDDGKLEVLDFDGLNRKTLVEKGVEKDKVITISGNNRYLYYFEGQVLIRERIN